MTTFLPTTYKNLSDISQAKWLYFMFGLDGGKENQYFISMYMYFSIMSSPEQKLPLCLTTRDLYLASSVNSGHCLVLNSFASSAF